MLLLMVAVDGDVTPVTQAITLAAVGGMITVLTILLNNRNNAKAEQRANDHIMATEEARRVEKEMDRQAAIDKEQRDYARQDLVAERLERATRVTLHKLTDVEDLGKVTHALVNSDKTATMKRELDSHVVTLALMHEVVSLKQDSGREATSESVNAIAALENQIKTLGETITERLAQQYAAEQRVELDRAQSGAALEAADRQVEAAAAQQQAADRQIEAAEGMAAVVAVPRLPDPIVEPPRLPDPNQGEN